MNRFELERKMKASAGLPGPSKALFLLLCTYFNNDAGQILADHQPSLTQLCRDGGWARSTVRDHLFKLEVAGWITRTPPHPDDARRKQARTHYMLHVPGSPELKTARAGRPPSMKPEARRARMAMAMQRARKNVSPARQETGQRLPKGTGELHGRPRAGGTATSPAIAAAIERARLADEAPAKPTPIPPAICMRCGAALEYCQCGNGAGT